MDSDPDSDRPYGLELADGVLGPDRAERELRVPASVVVTACQAWRGPVRRGDDGRHHMAGALFMGGARLLVMSHTEIDDQSSLDVMAGFYAAVAEGVSPAEALRRVRVRLKPTVDGVDPWLNASLIHAIGVAHEPLVLPGEDDAGSTRIVWFALIGVALITAAGWMVLRRRTTRS